MITFMGFVTFMAVWMLGFFVSGAYRHNNGSWLMFVGAMTGLSAVAVKDFVVMTLGVL